MTPVAALAWVTPWVDLSDAVDIASAPAIGLGYLVEGLVGFPAKGVRSLASKARGAEHAGGPARAATDRPFVPWGFVVEHFDAQRPTRPTEEVPRDIQEYYECVRRFSERSGWRSHGGSSDRSLTKARS
jgi:hypothetical protein